MIRVGSEYILRFIRLTGGGIHRYEIGPDKFQVVGVSSANSPLGSLVESAAPRVNSGTHYRIVRPDSTDQLFGRYESLAGIRDDRHYPFADEKQPCQDANPASGIASGAAKVHW